MSNIDTRVSVTCNDDDLPPQSYNVSQNSVEVKQKPICPSFQLPHLLLIIGIICILLGAIDMIVFYVIPYKEISNNKKKYPNYHFVKPDTGIVALHFLEHLFLIAFGDILVAAVNPKFYESFYFTMLLILIGVSFGSLYFIETLLAGLIIEYVKKEDFTFTQISKNINTTNPINNMLFYIRGSVYRKKGSYKTCYSQNGFVLPVGSKPNPPLFSPDENIPDYFYLEISQKVNMSNELFEWVLKVNTKMDLCTDRYNVVIDYYPLYEGKNLILKDGKKIPSKMKKPSAIGSLLFGLGVYPELLQKSIPVKKYQVTTSVDVDGRSDYASLTATVNCINIGSCQTSNDRPHL